MEKKLEVNNLRISFRTPAGKVQAVRNISFDLFTGETLAIVGESGSGKSVTNKAIIGISSGNAIIESGEIIYDGQDLLKISEEDFHKIRGDKIAMIFQDPMSSLNPIMRVGKQLTEAMILKNKASKRNARKSFNSLLEILNVHLNLEYPDDVQFNYENCKTFDKFCINSLRLEGSYNEVLSIAQELKSQVENILFLNSKLQPMNTKKMYAIIKKDLKFIEKPYFLKSEDASSLLAELLNITTLGKKHTFELSNEEVTFFNSLISKLNELINQEKINFFTLGFYMLDNPMMGLFDMPVSELNNMTRKYLDDNFMLKFIENGSHAIALSHNESIEKKRILIDELDAFIEMISSENFNLKTIKPFSTSLFKKVEDAIDKLEIVKNGCEYTFRSSLLNVFDKYHFGIKNNPKETRRFEKQTAKRNMLINKGKEPDWKVVPASLIDLELVKKDMIQVVNKLKQTYLKQIEDHSFDKDAKMVDLIDFFKKQASDVVYTVTKRVAKLKALKLLQEVGIPEPEIRYKQYPFQFSGGMRQRIVIAIALAANPDILICDEPTTALDVTIQSQILELINKLKKERNLSVIFITHDLGVVANMADRIAVMYAGKIVEYGTSDDVFYDPRHPYTWALLSSMPDLDTTEKLEAIPGTPPNMIFPPVGDAFAQRNKYALKIDFEQEPPLFDVSETHKAATWLLHPSAPKVEPPKIVIERILNMMMKMEESNDE